jgi:hypothetical protein
LEGVQTLVREVCQVLLQDDASVLALDTGVDAGLVVVGGRLVLESRRRSYMLRRFRREEITESLQGWGRRDPDLR